MAKINRTCIACHKKYSYCGTCAADANKPTWMAIFCCENCRNLYNTINDYRHKLLSKEEAYKKLKELKLSSAEELPKSFKESFDEIMREEVKVKKVVEVKIPKETVIEESNETPVAETIQETKVIEEKVEEKVEETKAIEEMVMKPRKKNYYRKNTVENTEE